MTEILFKDENYESGEATINTSNKSFLVEYDFDKNYIEEYAGSETTPGYDSYYEIDFAAESIGMLDEDGEVVIAKIKKHSEMWSTIEGVVESMIDQIVNNE